MKQKLWQSLFFVLILLTGSLSAQTGNSEIFVFDVVGNETIKLTGGKNISNSPGYDNQPSFSHDGNSILYTSIRDGKSPDIYEFSIADGTTKQITTSEDAEYTARAKDADTVYFVREGAGQEMTVWKYDRNTKVETRALTNKEPVAYYDWNGDGAALVWIRYAWMAHFVNPSKNINIFVSDRVLPSTPQNIPGTSKFSFVHRQGNDEVWIKEFDPETRAVRPIVQTKDGKFDYCWLTAQMLVMGSGSTLYSYVDRPGNDWITLAELDAFKLKDITRLAASPDGRKIAVVSNQ